MQRVHFKWASLFSPVQLYLFCSPALVLVHACVFSHVRCVWFFEMLWTVAHQAPLFMGFSGEEYRSRVPCPPSADVPDPGIKPTSLMCPALAGRFFATSTTWEALGSNAVLYLVTQSCLTLWSHGLQQARILCPWGFSRLEYWSGLPCSPLGDLLKPGLEPRSPELQADSLPTEPPGNI